MYTAPRERVGLLQDRTERSEELSMTAAEAFEQVAGNSNDAAPPYLYFTLPVEALDAQLLGRAPGWEQLACVDLSSDSRACPPWLQLWAGSAGSTTQAHYDVADNCFVQVWGSKEFYLWPPSAHAALHLYPDAHPRARKSQLCIEHPDLATHPLAASLPPPMRLTLQPGDALVVPAFWIHHVTARSGCTSLNVFSESPIKLAAAAVLQEPLPLHPTWPATLKRAGLAIALGELFDILGLQSTPLLARLLDSRFAPLAATASAPYADGASAGAPAAHTRRKKAPPPPSLEDLRPVLLDHARSTAAAFEQLRTTVHDTEPAYEARWRDEGSTEGWPDEWTGSVLDHHAALRELTVFHAIELWTLGLFGPAALEPELRRLRDS